MIQGLPRAIIHTLFHVETSHELQVSTKKLIRRSVCDEDQVKRHSRIRVNLAVLSSLRFQNQQKLFTTRLVVLNEFKNDRWQYPQASLNRMKS